MDSAVHNNRLDLARLFLQLGADVNAVDKVGYTPLLLAASIDFGDTGMIELLLAAGADINARNPAGRTALDLAREYQHTRFIAILERASREPTSAASIRQATPDHNCPRGSDGIDVIEQRGFSKDCCVPGAGPKSATRHRDEVVADARRRRKHSGEREAKGARGCRSPRQNRRIVYVRFRRFPPNIPRTALSPFR